jgi:MFS family permease
MAATPGGRPPWRRTADVTAHPGYDSARTDAAGSGVGRVRAALGIGAGNVLEGFDWVIYALFSPFFASQVFAGHDPTADLLKTLAVFAVGFLARPVGGFLFGALADRAGRRPTMAATIGLAGLSCLVIGLCPTHDQVGALAPVVLLLARLLQGLAHGGELPTAQTYLTELAPRHRRGLWSSLPYVSGSVGALGGTTLGAVLASTAPSVVLARSRWARRVGGCHSCWAGCSDCTRWSCGSGCRRARRSPPPRQPIAQYRWGVGSVRCPPRWPGWSG